jgi:uncharacterized membrane protein HdeD (DUF308 family)
MQNTICQWFVLVCLLFLPVGSDANIDSKKTPALANPVLANEQRHFPTANPLDRFRIPKIWRKHFEKHANILQNNAPTEGVPKKENSKKKTFWQRFFTVLLLVAAGILLVYWLQGTIGLLLATIGITSYWRNRDRIVDWERRRKEREYAYKNAPPKIKDYNGKSTDSLSHPANKWTRRALTRFLFGICGVALGAIFLVIAIISSFGGGGGDAIGIFAVAMFIIGVILVLTSISNAIKAIAAKEPQSGWAWIALILGIPLILTLLLGVLVGL